MKKSKTKGKYIEYYETLIYQIENKGTFETHLNMNL